jgi:hypothetical protein
MTFTECVLHCFDNRDLVNNFNRLTGCSLGVDRRSMIERMVDRAAGHEPPPLDQDEARLFIAFVYECIWTRLPPEAFAESAA